MKYAISLVIILLQYFHCFAQLPDISTSDFAVDMFDLDTTATAIVLLEKGGTSIQVSEADQAYMVFHNYKVRIKILKPEGFDQANFNIPLYKYGTKFEYILAIKGTTYNLENGKINSIGLEKKNIFSENNSDYMKLSKFTLPNIKVGSVIDVEYTIVSPDIFNFRTWEFQSDLPKLKSEYNVVIPSVYQYNVTLQGGLKLSETKSKIEKQCLFIHNTRVDCSNITYIMDNIPAFVEEAYMLAPKNYLSAVYFELEQSYGRGGVVQTYTKKWSDVDRDLLSEKQFGGQLKKQNFIKGKIDPTILAIKDPYSRANGLYYWIQKNIKWNNYYGKYSQNGIENALSSKNGNIADINLALIAALNAAGIEAYPILVSTRNNGLPNDLHPVISNFNYVIAGAKINDEIVQLDASDRLLPFAQLPLRAINGKGRIIYNKKSSEWIPLENKIISSTSYKFDGKLDTDGKIKGKLTISLNGLDAYNRRQQILKYGSTEEYAEKMDEQMVNIDLDNLEVYHLEDLANILNIETDIIVQTGQDITQGNFNLNPIFIDRIMRNPFNLDERYYPVDLGAKRNETYEISIEMPEGVTLIDGPKNVNLTLPESSAKYIYKSEFKNNTLSVIQLLSLSKSVYLTDEYFGLKELYSRIIQQLKIDYTFHYKSK